MRTTIVEFVRGAGIALGMMAGLALAACYSSSGGDGDVADASDAAEARDGDAATDARPDSPTGPHPTRFVLRFISDIPETVYAAAWEASSTSGHWLGLLDGATAMRKAESCGICDCVECPACAMCGAPCMELTAIENGGSVEYAWDGRRWVDAGTCGSWTCEGPQPVPAGSYTARFCWGTGRGGSLPCDEILLGETCSDVTFTLPDPDGVVDFLINNSG